MINATGCVKTTSIYHLHELLFVIPFQDSDPNILPETSDPATQTTIYSLPHQVPETFICEAPRLDNQWVIKYWGNTTPNASYR